MIMIMIMMVLIPFFKGTIAIITAHITINDTMMMMVFLTSSAVMLSALIIVLTKPSYTYSQALPNSYTKPLDDNLLMMIMIKR